MRTFACLFKSKVKSCLLLGNCCLGLTLMVLTRALTILLAMRDLIACGISSHIALLSIRCDLIVHPLLVDQV